MSSRRMPGLIGTCLFLAASFVGLPRAVEPLPKALSNKEFWSMVSGFSEPAGTFWENLVSNEPHYVQMIRAMRRTGGVYIGVGPEQNFSYSRRCDRRWPSSLICVPRIGTSISCTRRCSNCRPTAPSLSRASSR